ncbi:MAG: phosphopeptide-binding protein [Micrococcales bacterium]|nr:phosphopeptide-binding protein [Micrococcales bacterium]
MGLLQKFEDSLDRVVNGAFAKAFKAEVQPVELAAALQRDVDDRASVLDRDRTVIPNVFHVELSDHDYKRLAVFKDALAAELATLVTTYAGEQHYTLLGEVRVTLSEDDELETGIFRVRSEAKAEVTSRAGVVEAAEPAPPASAAAAPSSAASAAPEATLSPYEQPAAQSHESSGSQSGGQPRLEVGGQAYPLLRAITLMGRGTDADIRVEDPGVSRKHCEIVVGNPAIIRDLKSTNGTFVDGIRIDESTLTEGAIVKLGGTAFTFRSS